MERIEQLCNSLLIKGSCNLTVNSMGLRFSLYSGTVVLKMLPFNETERNAFALSCPCWPSPSPNQGPVNLI